MAGSSPSTFFNVKETSENLLDCISKLERELTDCGYDIEKLVGPLPIASSMEEIAARATRLVDGLKSSVRLDVELYRKLSEIVHIRIRTKTAPMCDWLHQRGLSKECSDFIIAQKKNVCKLMELFLEFYPKLSRVGLQSARKFEFLYLGKLKDGRLESVPQFFLRIAAEAARGALETPEFARALTSGLEVPNAGDLLQLFFVALCKQEIVPPTPVMLFAGTTEQTYASCFLLDVRAETTRDFLTSISREIIPVINSNGGIGMHLECHEQRHEKTANSPHSMMLALKSLDSILSASNAFSKRPTGLCVYVEPWHCDIMKILRCRGVLAGNEEERCDNLFFAVWVPDLFMKRFEENGMWTLFDGRARHLSNLYGEEFEAEYERLEKLNIGTARYPAKDVMFAIIKSAVATGTPFVMFKDSVNKHYFFDMAGRAMKCSNLCTEIVHMTDEDSIGVCNLVSINVAALVENAQPNPQHEARPIFDFDRFRELCSIAIIFVNSFMSLGKLPVDRAVNGNKRLRSIGMGVQGFHTACLLQGFGMTERAALDFNANLFELMALTTTRMSCDLCKLGLAPFYNFDESKYASGWLHMDGWPSVSLNYDADWAELRRDIKRYGLYNCQTIALMPTASSSALAEVSEGIHPMFGNIFSKITTSGEDVQLNKPLMDEISKLYPDTVVRRAFLERLNENKWSVKATLGKDFSPDHVLARFTTAFELDQRKLLQLCANRAPFVDHSQSTTLYLTEGADGALRASRVSNLLTAAFRYGLKTGMYYCKVHKATNNGVFLGNCGEGVCLACQ